MKRKLGPKGQIVIPKEIRERLNLNQGTTLTFELSDKTILVRPEPPPEEVVERYLSVRGKKSRKLLVWRSTLDDAYKAPGR